MKPTVEVEEHDKNFGVDHSGRPVSGSWLDTSRLQACLLFQ